MRSLVWFRRDLRVTDNSALHYAAKQSKQGVIGLFVLTPQQWRDHQDAPCKIKFWLDSVKHLSEQLKKLQIPLRIESCDTFADVPELVRSVATKWKCNRIYWNREYEANESRRDDLVKAECEKQEIEVHSFHDRVIVPPESIKTKEGKFYSVFTPYRRVWDTHAIQTISSLSKPRKQPEINVASSRIPKTIPGFDFSNLREDLWPAGEAEGRKRLEKFSEKAAQYHDARDIPSINGTSLLSPHLVAGTVSPRQCLTLALSINQGKISGHQGVTTWISELTWRDFYAHVLVGFPRVSKHQPFKLKTNAIHWRTNQEDLTAWQQGQTGYPIVDAGMRQLAKTGWMHNRLRMVTAMFLTKHLLIDWKLGERFFMQHLIDGDLAANNGGWQWSASTGTDSVPYFRIFNPFSQSKRFDPDAKFIKKLCPELVDVPPAAIHHPEKLTQAIAKQNLAYPSFIVDHKTGRDRALKTFKQLN